MLKVGLRLLHDFLHQTRQDSVSGSAIIHALTTSDRGLAFFYAGMILSFACMFMQLARLMSGAQSVVPLPSHVPITSFDQQVARILLITLCVVLLAPCVVVYWKLLCSTVPWKSYDLPRENHFHDVIRDARTLYALNGQGTSSRSVFLEGDAKRKRIWEVLFVGIEQLL